MKELFLPEGKTFQDLQLHYRISIRTETTADRLKALDLLESDQRPGEEIVVIFDRQTVHNAQIPSISILALPEHIKELLEIGCEDIPDNQWI